jgi:hypothetical protein
MNLSLLLGLQRRPGKEYEIQTYRISRFNSSWGIIVSNPTKGWGTIPGWGIIPGEELLFGT